MDIDTAIRAIVLNESSRQETFKVDSKVAGMMGSNKLVLRFDKAGLSVRLSPLTAPRRMGDGNKDTGAWMMFNPKDSWIVIRDTLRGMEPLGVKDLERAGFEYHPPETWR